MSHSTPAIAYQATDDWDEATAHGFLVAAHDYAKRLGLFSCIGRSLTLKMKTVDYSWLDKLSTLWASIVIGCNHTLDINCQLGAHEQALAAVFGFERFPDQSQINRLLTRFQPCHVEQWRALHLRLLGRHSRAKRRRRWMRMANGDRVLCVDLDQRALTVSSTGFELAAKGYFGRKRGRYGYQLSMAFLGGSIGEVLDEYLDSGTTTAAARLDDLFGSLDTFRRRIGIKATEVLLRGDAQYGTPDILRKIEAFGFRYLFKGFSPQRARRLFTRVPSEAIFHAVPNGAARELAWVCDLGQIEHVPGSSQQRSLAVRARTLLMERTFWMHPKRRPGPRTRAKRPRAEDGLVAQHRFDYFLTNLTPTQMPLDHLLEVYHGRSTIERYFYDEQYGLGARQVRTHSLAGESIFEFLVATTNNLLRWMRETVFKDTPIEHLGLQRLVHWVMQIPARIRRVGARLIVQLPSRHEIIRLLIASPGAVLTTIGDT